MKARLPLLVIILCFVIALPTRAQTTVTPTLTATGSYVRAHDIYVRGGPGENYVPVGRLVAGDLLFPVNRSQNGSWVMIYYNSGFGWIRRDLAVWSVDIATLPTLDGTSLTPTVSPTNTPVFSNIQVDAGAAGAYVRFGPGLNYPFLGAIVTGDYVDPVGRNVDGDWILIRFRDGFGWISRSLLNGALDLSSLPVLLPDALTPSATPSRTPTPRFSPTPTSSDTPTLTATLIPTNTPIITATLTPSSTPTLIPTNTHTNTATATATDTATATNTATSTSTRTPSDTPTRTNTATATSTSTDTPSPTPTRTNTPVPTRTPSNTPSPTPRPTRTNTATATATDTPTDTPTRAGVISFVTPPPSRIPPSATPPTATRTAARTPTEAPSETSTRTPSPAPTRTRTNTATATSTLTDTPSPTQTETATATDTATRTATRTSSPTASASPTATATSTRTASPSPTPSSSPTATSTATTTSTATPSPTQSPVPAAAATGAPPTATQAAAPAAPRIPPEAVVGGALLVLVLAYVALYWRALVAADRFADGFIAENCPVCKQGHLHVEMRRDRLLGIARPRAIVRCDNCRSVLREVGNHRWRYAIDRTANPQLYNRLNGKVVSDELLRTLAGQTPAQPPSVHPPRKPPTFLDDEE